jgi:hypothetical protein
MRSRAASRRSARRRAAKVFSARARRSACSMADSPLEASAGSRSTLRDAPHVPDRQRETQVVERFRALRNSGVVLENGARLFEREPVPVEETLEAQRHWSQPPGLRRRPPLSEALVLEIDVEAVDHRRHVGLEGAPPFEPGEDLVVVLDEPELDGGCEVFGVGAAKGAARADPVDHPFDEGELRGEDLGAGHCAPADRAREACLDGVAVRRMIARSERAAGRHAGPRGATHVPPLPSGPGQAQHADSTESLGSWR